MDSDLSYWFSFGKGRLKNVSIFNSSSANNYRIGTTVLYSVQSYTVISSFACRCEYKSNKPLKLLHIKKLTMWVKAWKMKSDY